MSKTNIILAVLAVAVVVLVWGATSLFKSVAKTPDTFVIGEQFIEALSAGDLDTASGLAVSNLQTPESRVALETFVATNADLFTNSTSVTFTGRGVDNELRYASGTINSNGIEAPIYMEFLNENGDTRVSFFSFEEEDMPNYADPEPSVE